MKEQAIIKKEIKYGDVSLTELQEVGAIYNNVKAKVALDTDLLQSDVVSLKENFGLPLVFGKSGNEVIGFAAVVVNPSFQIEINCYFRDGFESLETQQILNEKARKIIDTTFVKDSSKLNAAIIKLTDWWNSCN
ncbi:hypothetical protein [Flavobacterium sp. WC2509]|uniref:hypothetical protein n=1 Tax=Flavobacterium sp. WC2509 TaxID=3461406 RepID=UPI00404453AA